MAKDAVYQAFGKRLAELTPDERTLWRRAVRMASYYRKHTKNKAQARKDQSWRKVEILEVLGWPAACMKCEYDGYIGALDFHHIDPSGKVGNVMNVKRADAIEEARKCVLVCKNCHAEAHKDLRVKNTGRPTEALHPQVAAYLRAVGVSRPGEAVGDALLERMQTPESKAALKRAFDSPLVGRLGDGTVCEEAGSVLVNGRGWVKPIELGHGLRVVRIEPSEATETMCQIDANGAHVGKSVCAECKAIDQRQMNSIEMDSASEFEKGANGECATCGRFETECECSTMVCKTSGTAQCTCEPNGICNDCTVDVSLW